MNPDKFKKKFRSAFKRSSKEAYLNALNSGKVVTIAKNGKVVRLQKVDGKIHETVVSELTRSRAGMKSLKAN